MVVFRTFACCLTVAVLMAFFNINPAQAIDRRPDYSPAKHPDYALLSAETNSATVRYTRPGDNPLLNEESQIFVGIPIGATYSIEPISWELAYYKNRELVEQAIAGQPASVTHEVEPVLVNAFEPEVHEFYQLDVLRLTLNPLVDAPWDTQTSTYNRAKFSIKSLTFKVRWQQPEPHEQAKLPAHDSGYKRLYDDLLINAGAAQAFRQRRSIPGRETVQGFDDKALGYDFESSPNNPAFESIAYRGDGMRVRTRQAGVVAIQAQDVSAQGVDPEMINLEQVRLWHRGQEQTLYIQNDSTPQLNEGDAIFFYTPETDSEYTNDRVYFLTWSEHEKPPKRAEDASLKPAESGNETYPVQYVIDEENKLVQMQTNEYGWFNTSLTERRTEFPIELSAPAAVGGVTVQVDLLNKTRRDSDFVIQMGQRRTRAEVGINEATTVTRFIEPQILSESMTFAIVLDDQPEAPSDSSLSARVGSEPFIHINSIAVQYPRGATFTTETLQIDQHLLPQGTQSLPLQTTAQTKPFSAWVVKDDELLSRLRGQPGHDDSAIQIPQQAWDHIILSPDDAIPNVYTMDKDIPTTLHHVNQGYDYIIIAHQIFLEEARRLAQIRKEDGFTPLLVDVQDIYDEYNYGYPHSEAIHRFLRYAQAEWEGLSPEFVCLIGDSSWDHRDRENMGAVDQVPTYAPVSNPQFDGTDEYYAYLWQDNNDTFSDLIIGRISVREPEELKNYIDKLTVYRNEMPVGPWKMRNVFITDDTFERYGNESARESLPAVMMPRHIDQIDFPHVTNPYLYHRFQDDPAPAARQYTNKKYCPECTEAIVDSFDEGALLVQYIGHGGNQIWSHERIFYGTDRPYSNVLELASNDIFPFILNWSCLTGYLNYNVPPFNVCLAEEFIRYADKGGIAMWAPSGSGSTDQHMLMTHLMKRKLLNQGMLRLGEAITSTKVEYLQIQYHPQLMEQYILFGDPAVELAMPDERLDVSVSPGLMQPGSDTEYIVETALQSFNQGQAVVAMSVDGNKIYQSEPFEFQNKTFTHSFSMAHDKIEYATGKISVYAWNETQNLDAWGGATVTKYAPVLKVTKGEATLDGNNVTLKFFIHNDSSFDVAETDFKINLTNRIETVAVSDLTASATHVAEWSGPVPEGIYSAYIELANKEYAGTTSLDDGVLVEFPGEKPPVYPILGKRRVSSSEPIEKTSVRVQIPFVNNTGIDNATALIALAGPGAATDTKELTVPAERERSVDFVVDLPQAGLHDYILTMQHGENTKEFTFPIDVLGQPDLALAEGDFEISPEKPVVGKTVRIKTRVYNVGNGPATDVTINAYDGDPTLNRVLKPFNRRRSPEINRIEPGEMREIEFVWDPDSYEGLGLHEIHIVVDPHDRVTEMSEGNNRINFPMTFHNLPDLVVHPWQDHSMSTETSNGFAQWGQPLNIDVRVRNMGESDAENVRVSIMHNGQELTRFMDRIRPKVGVETEFSVPLVSPKNTLRVYADKYDLIGEIDEKAEDPGNNQSLEKRMYVDLIMPETPVVERFRTYEIQNESQYASGFGEYIIYDERYEHLILHPELNSQPEHIQPVYVQNKDIFDTRRRNNKWWWNYTHNVFIEPEEDDTVMRLDMPAPTGTFDVYVRLFSSAHDTGDATSVIEYKTPVDPEYVSITHPNKQNEIWYKLGRYDIKDDNFLIEFRSTGDGPNTSVHTLRYDRVEGLNAPVSNSYRSSYFPATGATGRMAELTWDAEVPDGTEMIVKARWASFKDDGTLRYTPWARTVPGQDEKLQLAGKGDFFQFNVDFIRHTWDAATPELSNIKLKIPCEATK